MAIKGKLKNQLQTMNFSFGIGASFLDNVFETALHFGILNQQYTAGRKEEYRGFEFGLDLIYNKFGTPKDSTDNLFSLLLPFIILIFLVSF